MQLKKTQLRILSIITLSFLSWSVPARAAITFIGLDFCKNEDKSAANSLENKLESCKFETTDETVNNTVYKRCITDSLNFFNKIKASKCKGVYLSPLITTLRNTVTHHVEAKSDWNDDSKLAALFEHVNTWVVVMNEQIYHHAENLNLFKKGLNADLSTHLVEAAQLADEELIVNSIWSTYSQFLKQNGASGYLGDKGSLNGQRIESKSLLEYGLQS